MNARQKAKKYKRMYEALSAKWMPPIEFKVEDYKVDTIKSDLILDERCVAECDMNYIKEIMINDITQYLLKYFDEYVNYDMEHTPYGPKHLLHFQMKVIRRPNNDNNNT